MKCAFIFTLAAAAATANPLTYPQGHKWNFSIGVENGIESQYESSKATSGAQQYFETVSTAYKLSSTQTVGYGRWFYLQSRLSYSMGYPISYIYHYRYTRNNTFDGDWSLFVPFRLPSKHRITLGPQLGCAYLQNKERIKHPDSNPPFTTKEARYFAPLMGLALGFEPTQALSMRFVLNFQFPRARIRSYNSTATTPEPWTRCSIRRSGLNAYLNVMYQLSKHLELAGTLEHKSYAAYGPLSSTTYTSANCYRTSGTFGVKWVF